MLIGSALLWDISSSHYEKLELFKFARGIAELEAEVPEFSPS